ncbi:MAG: DUF4162 domain-containing protein, partial [Pirellulales bacterium]
LSVIRSLEETRDVRVENGRLTVEFAANDEQMAAILQRLVSSGVELRSFAEKDPTLEDVFMMVTKGLVG